jgi:hypothetical protein
MGCLALNASFEPLTILPVERALRLVIDRKAEILEVDVSRVFRSSGMNTPARSSSAWSASCTSPAGSGDRSPTSSSSRATGTAASTAGVTAPSSARGSSSRATM